MSTKFGLICAFSLFILSLYAKEEGSPPAYQYEIECAGSGIQGTYLVKVSIYVEKDLANASEVKKAAVHGIIFKGYESNGRGCNAQKPLTTQAGLETEKSQFFNTFFGGNGQFANYATLVEGTYSSIKMPKKMIKVVATVSVKKELLRKYLEDSGVIKSLSDGF